MATEEAGARPEEGNHPGEGNGASEGGVPEKKEKVNYYEVLGVDQDADEATIRKVYKKKALKLHPDKNRDDPDAQEKFALLNEALQVLTDPVKRIDHNKDLEGDVVGWGYDRKAAAERARNYQWKHPGATAFNSGNDEEPRTGGKYSYVWQAARQAAVLWGAATAVIAALEALMVVTAIHIGMPQAAVIWGSVLGGFFLIGVVVGLKTDEWTFAAGGLCMVVCGTALVVGLLGADLLVQAHTFHTRMAPELDVGGMAATQYGVYSWGGGAVVDAGRAVAGEGVCVAPIVRPEQRESGNYSLAEVPYWAVASRCCGEGQAPTCEGWGEAWGKGINWWMPERAASLFLQDEAGASAERVYGAIRSVGGGSAGVGPVAVAWSEEGAGEIARRFAVGGWVCLVLLTLFWPVALCLAWALLTLGFVFFKPKLHCNQPLFTWCCYVTSGCPGCWSELEVIDE